LKEKTCESFLYGKEGKEVDIYWYYCTLQTYRLYLILITVRKLTIIRKLSQLILDLGLVKN